MADEQELPFDRIGGISVEAGLDANGDQAWLSRYEGLNPMEVVGLLTVVRQRLLMKLTQNPQEEE